MENQITEKKSHKRTARERTLDTVLIALFAALISGCSMISIPAVVPFTLQTFGVFCAVGILGGKRGTLSVLIYIALGAFGLPVFSGFTGGVGVLMGPTGGYIAGFLILSLTYWLITKLFGEKTLIMIIAMFLGLILCYAFGTVWFIKVYSASKGAVNVLTALSWCVFPFIIPDALKLSAAVLTSKRLPKYIKLK